MKSLISMKSLSSIPYTYTILRALLLLIFSTLANSAYSITDPITGDITPPVSYATNYTFASDIYFASKPTWSVSPSGMATVGFVMLSSDRFTSYAPITFNTTGSATITISYGGNVIGSLNVTAVGPDAPTFQITSGPVCGPSSVIVEGVPGNGANDVKWYTQATGGTAFHQGLTYTTPTLSSTTSYYISSFNSTLSLESSRTQATVTINPLPGTPTNPNAPVLCTEGGVTLTAVPASPATSIIWYNASTGGEALHTGTSFERPSVKFTSYYYAASYNTTTGCISPTRLEVQVVRAEKPQIQYVDVDKVYGSGQVGMVANVNDPAAEIKWYTTKANADLYNTSSQFTGASVQTANLVSSVTYWVRAKDLTTGCLSDVFQTKAEILPLVSSGNVKKDIIRVDGIKTDASVNALTDLQKSTAIVHMDGVGRVVQQIAVKASANQQKDIVQPVEYDTYGRTSKSYLPYVSSVSTGDFQQTYKVNQITFYGAPPADKVANDTKPYAMSLYEDSPLGRIKEQGGIGNAFQPGTTTRTTKYIYGFNTGATTQTEGVRIFNSDGSSSGFYAANKLHRIESTDPQGNKEIIFQDMNGQVICKKTQLDKTQEGVMVNYIQTYYYYNDLGQLRFIIQPKGVTALTNASWVITQALRDEHFFVYDYDHRGRVVEKKVPGAGVPGPTSPGVGREYIVYDQLNRPVLTQDANLRASNKWMFTKYDSKGRPIISGLYTDNVNVTRASLQAVLDAKNYDGTDKYFEERGTTTHGYTNVAFPTTSFEVLAVNYYDNLDFDNNGSADQSHIVETGVTSQGTPASSFGLATGSKTVVHGTSNWLVKYVFHDKYGRPIQVKSNNHLNLVVNDRSTTIYDFEKVVLTKVTHDAGGTNQVTTLNRPEYDASGRIVKVKQGLNGGAELLVAKYEYNELGQLVDKKLHGTGTPGSETFLQSVDYRYTIHGQLFSINNSELQSDTDNDETNDYFGMELFYHLTETGLGNAARNDLKVSAMKWKSIGASSGVEDQRSYRYVYDKSGRLESAIYKVRGATTWDKEVNAQDELMTYDVNGNIKTLTRTHRKHQLTGIIASYISEQIDNLTYTYTTGNANRLLKVTDGTNPMGFNNGTSSTGNDFTYDERGSITADANKGVSSIIYNYLGKPTEINFNDTRKIVYQYNAFGAKLKMSTYASSTATPVVTDYVDNFVYVNGALSFFGSPEGRVVKNGGTFEYQYAISDHQGNTRIVFSSVQPAVQSASTDFETNPGTLHNFPTGGNLSGLALFNQTSGGTKSQLLNGGNNSRVGVGKDFAVYPGDKIKIVAYAKYQSGGSSPSVTFATALLSAFGESAPAPGETGTRAYALNTFGGFVDGGGQDQSAAPEAYVNIIVFDKNYNLLDATWDHINGGEQIGVSPDVAHDEMMKEYTIKEPGYVFVYVSNNSPVNVYFDDVTITNTPSRVIQYNEYYAFGLQTSSSWTRENSKNDYLYNAGSELNSMTGWYETMFRGYDPALGRFLQVDPLALLDNSTSPYVYGADNPILFNDPTGLLVSVTGMADNQVRALYRANMWRGYTSFDSWAEANINPLSFGFSDYTGADGRTYTYNTKRGGWGFYTQEVIWSGTEQRNENGVLEVLKTGTVVAIWNTFETENTSNSGFLDVLKSIWNNPLTRAVTGDAITISGNLSMFIYGGTSVKPSGILIPLRGKDAFNIFLFSDAGAGTGMEISISANFGKLWYLGDHNDITAQLLGGDRAEASVGITAAFDIGGSLSYSPTQAGGGVIGTSVNIGAGIPVPFAVSGNLNVGHTKIWGSLF
jgi:RHS repeat-associated protein